MISNKLLNYKCMQHLKFITILFLIINFSCDNNPAFENCIEDNCGICNENPNDDCQQDCFGDWGGNSEIDCNGICGGNSILDCNANCISPNENGSYIGNFENMDCNGICGGQSIIDECGVCNGPGEVYGCGCYGFPQRAYGGEAGNSNFIITESHNYPIEQNQIFTGISYEGFTITQNCGILTNLDIIGEIDNVYNIIFYSPLGNYHLANNFDYLDTNCNTDDSNIDINFVCSDSFPTNTIYINNNDELLYKSSIDIKSFTFTIDGATVPISCDCYGNKYDCNNICGGNTFNEYGCCDNNVPDCLGECGGNYVETPYDSDSDGSEDSFCPCLVELNSDGCCCDEIKDCALVCGGNAITNECNICVGGTTGINIDQNDWNTGPYGSDCLGNCGNQAIIDCNGVCNGEEEDLDEDGICDYEDNCIGTAEECQENIDSGCDLPINHIYLLENNSVIYNTDFNIGGFQFVVEGANLTGASGGDAAAAGFAVSTSSTSGTVIGFSFTGSIINEGCGTLTVLTLDNNAELINIVFSDEFSQQINVEYYNQP